MKLSACSQIKGVIITPSITSEAVDDVALMVDDTAAAIIKASDVRIGK